MPTATALEEEQHLECDGTDDFIQTPLRLPSSTDLGAQFILKTRDGKGLTQTTTDEILHDVKTVLQNTVKTLEQEVLKKVDDLQVITKEELKRIFVDETLINPFKNLDTPYKQEKYISSYVVSHKNIRHTQITNVLFSRYP